MALSLSTYAQSLHILQSAARESARIEYAADRPACSWPSRTASTAVSKGGTGLQCSPHGCMSTTQNVVLMRAPSSARLPASSAQQQAGHAMQQPSCKRPALHLQTLLTHRPQSARPSMRARPRSREEKVRRRAPGGARAAAPPSPAGPAASPAGSPYEAARAAASPACARVSGAAGAPLSWPAAAQSA